MPTPSMAQPERELRKDYADTQQMQVAQLQNEYSQKGFTILRGATDLEGVRRDVWAAYDPRTGDTYVFSRTRESSFGTGQQALDAVGKWVDKQNGGIALQNIGEGIAAQTANREFQELGTEVEARRRAREEQPAQAAAETPVQAGARTTEGRERQGTVLIGEGEQVKEEGRAAPPPQPARGGVETREIVRGTPVGTQRTATEATGESYARISLTYGPSTAPTEEHFYVRAADQRDASAIERESRAMRNDLFLDKYRGKIVGVDVDGLIQRIHESQGIY